MTTCTPDTEICDGVHDNQTGDADGGGGGKQGIDQRKTIPGPGCKRQHEKPGPCEYDEKETEKNGKGRADVQTLNVGGDPAITAEDVQNKEKVTNQQNRTIRRLPIPAKNPVVRKIFIVNEKTDENDGKRKGKGIPFEVNFFIGSVPDTVDDFRDQNGEY